MVVNFLMFFLVPFIAYSGEIDGKGVTCKVYGDTVGFFFENDRVHELFESMILKPEEYLMNWPFIMKEPNLHYLKC